MKAERKAKLIQAALEAVNEARKMQGRRPLRKMPKGARAKSRSCPIASGINTKVKAVVVGTKAFWTTEPGECYPLPRPESTLALSADARKFVTAFDRAEIPELIDWKTELPLAELKEELAYAKRVQAEAQSKADAIQEPIRRGWHLQDVEWNKIYAKVLRRLIKAHPDNQKKRKET